MDSCQSTENGKPRLDITFDTIRDKTIEQLRILNSVLLPIDYKDTYYKDVLASGDLSQFALYNAVSIGAIACRLEQGDDNAKVYIMTIGVLAPYRRLGVGTSLIRRLLKACMNRDIGEVYLHVQTSNEDAINFYKRLEFEVVETIPDYYSKLEPSSAVVLSRKLLKSN